MEGPVSEIRKTFLHDLTQDYLNGQKGSLLYRAFWTENMKRLLKAHFPDLLSPELSVPKSADELKKLAGKLKKQLCEAMKERPGWADELPARKWSWQLRRDFWEELWLNDAGYRAGLIGDTEYYLWLVRYLVVHDVYYKTNIYSYQNEYDERIDNRTKRPGHPWLHRLLKAGLGMDEDELKREIWARKKARREERKEERKKARKKPAAGVDLSSEAPEEGPSEEEQKAGLSLADVEEALAMLSEQIQADRDKIAGRLHGLLYPTRDKDGRLIKKDYLLQLTARLEWMALHVKIRNWLQDSGYPLRGDNRRKGPPKARKSDFTMRLFEAWCDSYELRKRAGDDETDDGGWRLEGQGFCVLDTAPDPDQLRALLEDQAAEQDETPHFYLPLAVHLRSGCVFFLAGKGNYEKAYQGDEHEDDYNTAQERYCFDYLRLAKNHSLKPPGDGAFCLSPAFHENTKHKYKVVLDAFKDHCNDMVNDSPLQTVREYNGSEPAGIPEALLWAFDIDDDSGDVDD